MVLDPLAAALVAVRRNRESLRGEPGRAGIDATGLRGPQGPRGESVRGDPGQPGLIWRGKWARGATYQSGDVVESGGSAYVAVLPSQGQKPPGPAWDLLAAKGADGMTQVIGGGGGGSPGGGATPTLAEVLVAGNDPNWTLIAAASGLGASQGGSAEFTPGDPDTGQGGAMTLRGGLGETGQHGGNVTLSGGFGDAGLATGARLEIIGGSPGPGLVALKTDDSTGTNGQTVTSDGDYLRWTSLLSSGAGAPGASFTTLLYFDTDAVTGGLYAWNGSAYTKVGLATT